MVETGHRCNGLRRARSERQVDARGVPGLSNDCHLERDSRPMQLESFFHADGCWGLGLLLGGQVGISRDRSRGVLGLLGASTLRVGAKPV